MLSFVSFSSWPLLSAGRPSCRAASSSHERACFCVCADHSYWHLAGGKVVSLWVALDVVPGQTTVRCASRRSSFTFHPRISSPADTSPLPHAPSIVRYAAGSHKWNLKHRIKSFSGDAARYAGSEELPQIPDVDDMERKGEARHRHHSPA